MFVELFPILSHNDLHSEELLVLTPLIEEKLNMYVDSIKARLVKEDLKTTSDGLRSYLFDLRLDILRVIKSNQRVANKERNDLDIVEEIHRELENLFHKKVKDSQIPFNRNLSTFFRNYKSIEQLVLEKAANDPTSVIPIDTSKLHISYEALKYIESLVPSFTYVRKMIDASLNFEFGLFVADLLTANEIINRNEPLRQEIIPFLRKSLTDYGTNAILSNLWIPTIEQLDQPFFNKMKIKASIINSTNNNTVTFSINQLEKLAAS